MKCLSVWVACLSLVLGFGGGTVKAAAKPDDQARKKQEVAKSVDAFAADLYGQVRGEKGNLFFSPYSITSCLSMAYAGAKGETAAEMAKTLRLPADWLAKPEVIAAAFGYLNADYNARDKPYALSVANALWGQKGYGFLNDFLTFLDSRYGAGLHEVDFAKDTEGARAAINAWVEKETKDKIKDLIPPGALSPQTRLVLANAIYFKGTWASQFQKKATKNADFLLAPGEKVSAPMMRQQVHFQYLDGGGFQALQMPYKADELAMLVLLPKQIAGLDALEESLTAEKLAEWVSKLGWAKVDVTMPRFKVTWQSGLAKCLQKMGMNRAFDPGKADFSGISGGKEPLWISEVIHKAFVDVNEEGTEAAAATAAIMVGGAPAPSKPVIFRADHPFLFLIRDVRSGCILFMGRVANPVE
jgi:serpin B